MVDMLLDETLFADFRVGDEGARAIVEDILDGNVKAGISPLTAYRVWRGLGMDRRAEIVLLSLLRFVEEAPLSVDAAKRAGLWAAEGQNEQGEQGEGADDGGYYALVASTALDVQAPVCTRNAAAFERFGADVLDY